MRFPWHRRAEAQRKQADEAEQQLARVRQQRPKVEAAVAHLGPERVLNGFTDNILGIFEGRQGREPR